MNKEAQPKLEAAVWDVPPLFVGPNVLLVGAQHKTFLCSILFLYDSQVAARQNTCAILQQWVHESFKSITLWEVWNSLL